MGGRRSSGHGSNTNPFASTANSYRPESKGHQNVPRKKKECKFWKRGTCRFGDKCTYAHPRNRKGTCNAGKPKKKKKKE
ncbi:hypothetical protein PG994_006251 [Apiospora phragmitis]|uniref:C3H1-type domain-containing protein n=1 Tax=Apiospora phragmitis TaxID=2905665 RepID=A0ABR1VHC1_9PEZI